MKKFRVFTKSSRVGRNYILDGEGGRRPEGVKKGISEDWKNRGIGDAKMHRGLGDAKMHRGIEEWLFNDSSLNEIPQKPQTENMFPLSGRGLGRGGKFSPSY